MVNSIRKILLLAAVFGFVFITTAAADTWTRGSVDSDYDGLSDFNEIIWYRTDKNNADTDGDGVGDGWEAEDGTDPKKKDSDNDNENDGEEDNDCDGEKDGDEDTDKDGVVDSEEDRFDTKQWNADSDGDKEGDGYEKGDNSENHHEESHHVSQCSRSIPEFPTVALPIAAVFGLVFFLQRKKKNEEA
jgi:hypothetical protein